MPPDQSSFFALEFPADEPTYQAIKQVQKYVAETVEKQHGYRPVQHDEVFTAIESLTHLVGGLVASNRSLAERVGVLETKLASCKPQ